MLVPSGLLLMPITVGAPDDGAPFLPNPERAAAPNTDFRRLPSKMDKQPCSAIRRQHPPMYRRDHLWNSGPS